KTYDSDEPKTNGIPQATEETGDTDIFTRNELLAVDDFTIEGEFNGADLLPSLDRRDQRLTAGQCRFNATIFTLGQRNEKILGNGSGQSVLFTFPDLELADRVADLIDELRLVELEAIVQQFLTFSSPRVFRSRTKHNRDEAHVSTLCGSHQAVACGFSMACLDAIDVRVAPKQKVAVRLCDIVVRIFFDGIEAAVLFREVTDQCGCKHREITRCRVMVRVR